MSKRNQIAATLLAAILLLLAYVIYSNRQPAAVVVATGSAQGFVALAVENPALRLDLLKELKSFDYSGSRRNIFSATPLPVETPAQQAPVLIVAPPIQLAGPPPLTVPAMFFGRVTDTNSGSRRAFFSAGDDVYVLGLGEVLLNRFRLLQIGENTAELEELASGRRTTLTMEQPSS